MSKKPEDPSVESAVQVSVPEETPETEGVAVQIPPPSVEPASSGAESKSGQKATTEKKEG